jgi:hypothetical protein
MTSSLRIVAIVMIFLGATAAWQVLGAVTDQRTRSQGGKLGEDVRSLWGRPQTQTGPQFRFAWATPREQSRTEEEKGEKRVVKETVWDSHEREVLPGRTEIDADLHLDQRLRGLMWYALYGVTFDGRWQYVHEAPETGELTIDFKFPVPDAIYDDFRFVVDGQDLGRTLKPEEGGVSAKLRLRPGQTVDFQVHYRTRGLDVWSYQPRASGVANLRNFSLRLACDFADIDYPAAAMSPSDRHRTGGGWALGWTFSQVLTGQAMGLVMPSRIQPGELASALAQSAPISLLFFFLLLFALSVLRGLDIHPINYLGVAAAFFAFHLLFSYSVDHIRVVPAFVVASAASILLVATYLRLVVSPRFAYREAALAQLVYQVGFSAAHFLPGYTGLTVSVLATLTLFILMQLTGRVRWSAVLQKPTAA